MSKANYITATANVGDELILTVPIAGGDVKHFISVIDIVRFVVTDLAAGSDPILITTTNIQGDPVFTFDNSGPKTGQVTELRIEPAFPFQSIDGAQEITITCPRQDKTLWRINLVYYTA